MIGDLAASGHLSADAAAWFAAGLADGSVTDAQAGAFAMAVRLKGLDPAERAALTAAMRDTGHVLAWDLPGPVVDKHSTGGIGDCVSLVLAPALAACGVYVPMVSGRGLGHTGGTLDKLEAIPGLGVELDEAAFRRIVEETGAAIVAASPEIAPADRRLYAIRDVTGTVESVDLITASILSKKLAAGLEALILDVKAGSGAFLPDLDDARALATSLVETANAAGCRTAALVTAMDRPLAPCAGNALEVAASMEALEGAPGALRDLTVALGGALLDLVGIAGGEGRIAASIDDGSAMDRFARMVRAQGGPADFASTWRRDLPAAPVIRDVPAPSAGTVVAIDGRALGMAVVHLGGGRLRGGETLDLSVGLDRIARLGDRLSEGDPLARIHAPDEAAADRAAEAVREAIRLGETAAPMPLVIERIGP
nr:thymidine phosphorylase [Roseitranquillus sediminis]